MMYGQNIHSLLIVLSHIQYKEDDGFLIPYKRKNMWGLDKGTKPSLSDEP